MAPHRTHKALQVVSVWMGGHHLVQMAVPEKELLSKLALQDETLGPGGH